MSKLAGTIWGANAQVGSRNIHNAFSILDGRELCTCMGEYPTLCSIIDVQSRKTMRTIAGTLIPLIIE